MDRPESTDNNSNAANMKKAISLAIIGFLSLRAWAANPADEVKEAAAKLLDKPNYSWTTKVEQVVTNRFRGGPADGKTEKGGFTVFTFKNNDNTVTAVRKGEKVAVKQDDEWKTSDELAEGDGTGGRGARGNFMVGRVQRMKVPAEEAQELLSRVKELKKESDGLYSGDLTAEGVKAMYTFGGGRGNRGGRDGSVGADAGAGGNRGGRGGFGMDTSKLKVHAKFWVRDGVLAKYESRTEGKAPGFNRGGGGDAPRDIDMGRITTVEIQDVGNTKVEVPAEARKKLAK